MKSVLKKLGVGAGVVVGAFVVLWLMVAAVSLAHAAPPPKVTICHATSSPTNPWTRTVVSENATSGHFENNGTTKAGHEGDKLFQGDVPCPDVTPPVVDVCVNLDGPQATVPAGTWLNDKGACVEITHCTGNTYEIGKDQHGNSICKENPTGCPYAENIPVDSPKCVAPASDPVPTDPVTGEVFYGK